jgi:hypothetical protein
VRFEVITRAVIDAPDANRARMAFLASCTPHLRKIIEDSGSCHAILCEPVVTPLTICIKPQFEFSMVVKQLEAIGFIVGGLDDTNHEVFGGCRVDELAWFSAQAMENPGIDSLRNRLVEHG